MGSIKDRNGMDLTEAEDSKKRWQEYIEEYTVQGVVINTIPQKKKCKKAKWLSEEALQIAKKRREVKSKGEKERDTIWIEFQRIARRDKKAEDIKKWWQEYTEELYKKRSLWPR